MGNGPEHKLMLSRENRDLEIISRGAGCSEKPGSYNIPREDEKPGFLGQPLVITGGESVFRSDLHEPADFLQGAAFVIILVGKAQPDAVPLVAESG